MVENKKILWHHGTCDMCDKKFILVLHFGYDSPSFSDDESYRICKNCLVENIQYILYGAQDYKDGMID